MIHCNYCHIDKPDEEFSLHRKSMIRRTMCKQCAAEASRAWYHANRTRALARMRIYNQNRREESEVTPPVRKEPYVFIYKRRRIELPDGFGRCSACQAILPVSDFHLDRHSLLGRKSRCKSCRRVPGK